MKFFLLEGPVSGAPAVNPSGGVGGGWGLMGLEFIDNSSPIKSTAFALSYMGDLC